MKNNTPSKVDSKLMDIPHGALYGSQQIEKKLICLNFLLKTLPSSTSYSSSSDSSSERLLANMKIRNTLTIRWTTECGNINADCTSDSF